MKVSAYWLPCYDYAEAFCFRRQEYWTRIHVWPFCFLVGRAAKEAR